MNKVSLDGDYLIVRLHLENGVEFKCFVDTGSPGSVFPRPTEKYLGKRIGKLRIRTLDGSIEKENIYAAPKVYLGGTQLITGERVGVWKNPEGILGMDFLRHYRIQFDFQTGKIRFLNPGDTNTAKLGRAFPLTSLRYAYIRQDGFFGLKDSPILVDTGDPFDGMMNSKLLKRAIAERKAQHMPVKVIGDYKGKLPELAVFPTCVWGGETYTNLIVQAGHPNIIGLKFLARHQVTFDFPNKVMYLKHSNDNAPKAAPALPRVRRRRFPRTNLPPSLGWRRAPCA